MSEINERKFIVRVIKDLLSLTEKLKGKPNKAIVASNIMYVVMQYPRFLRNNWNFLKTVIKKLFEFMHEEYEGIKDMSVNTLLKIIDKCGDKFVTTHMDQPEPFIYEITRI
jgi:exportin-1